MIIIKTIPWARDITPDDELFCSSPNPILLAIPMLGIHALKYLFFLPIFVGLFYFIKL